MVLHILAVGDTRYHEVTQDSPPFATDLPELEYSTCGIWIQQYIDDDFF